MAAISQGIQSLISYLQNIGASINMPEVRMPENVKHAFDYASRSLGALMALLPTLPRFDVRAQLMIIGCLVPMLIDVIFVWFSIPLMQILAHIMDLIVLILTSMVITFHITVGWTTTAIVGTLCGVFYVVVRALSAYCKSRKKADLTLDQVIEGICDFHLKGIVPGISSDLTEPELKDVIESFSKGVEVQDPTPPGVCGTLMFLLFFCGLLFVALWLMGVIPGLAAPQNVLAVFLPYVLLPVVLIMLCSFSLQLCGCGRNLLLRIRQGIKRWGFRVLMLLLDLLYVPMLTAVVPLVFPRVQGCGNGDYLAYDRAKLDADDRWWEFVNHSSVCMPCAKSLVKLIPACDMACNGPGEVRLVEAPNLLFQGDVLATCGGLLVFGFFAGMFGIPLLTMYLVRRNREFLNRVRAWGFDIQGKWLAIISRLKTTGIFQLTVYKPAYAYWNLFSLVVKLGVIVLTTLGGRIWRPLAYVLPFWYFGGVLILACSHPYIAWENTLFDTMCMVGNTAFSAVPLFSVLGMDIGKDSGMVLGVLLVALPAIGLAVVFFTGFTEIDLDDPTVPEAEKAEARKKARKKAGKKAGTEQRETPPPNPDEPVTIEEGALDTIEERRAWDQCRVFRKTPEFQVTPRVLADKCSQMYELIDKVLDGSTIEVTTTILNVAMDCAAIALGWYLGSVRGLSLKREPLVCHVTQVGELPG